MKDIKFIKFLFEKAGDPFKVMVYPNCTHVSFPSREHSVFIEEFEKYCPDYVKSFLLQKAIEGINKDISTSWNIQQQWNYIRCCSDDIEMECFAVWEEDSYDQAKTSALKYIYKQEQTI